MLHEHSKEGGEGLRSLAAPLGTISCSATKGVSSRTASTPRYWSDVSPQRWRRS